MGTTFGGWIEFAIRIEHFGRCPVQCSNKLRGTKTQSAVMSSISSPEKRK
jgi:hypothetical protein